MRKKNTRLTASHFLPPRALNTMGAESADLRVRALHVVKACPEGISTSEIATAVEVTKPTVLKVLRELEREREIYSRAHTKNQLLIWYPNGKLIHSYLEMFRDLHGTTYRASIQEGQAGPTIQVQERTFSLLSGDRVEGAVFVELSAVDELIEMLNELKRRYETTNTGIVTTAPPTVGQ